MASFSYTGSLPYGGGVGSGTDSVTLVALANSNILQVGGQLALSGAYGGVTRIICSIYSISNRTWTQTGSLVSGIVGGTAHLLSNGKVVAIGCHLVGPGACNTRAQIYNSSLGTWSYTADSFEYRYQHNSVLLSTGKILVAGGLNAPTSCQLYDPTANSWSTTGNFNTGRWNFGLIDLGNGYILAIGGATYGTPNLTSCELYNVSAGTWAATGSLTNARHIDYGGNPVLLQNGKVLIVGGNNGSVMNSCELYDPAATTWSSVANLNNARTGNPVLVLFDGKASTYGEYGISGNLTSCELYDPNANTWVLAGNLSTAAVYAPAIIIGTNQSDVLLVGGATSATQSTNTCEIVNLYEQVFNDAETLSETLIKSVTKSPFVDTQALTDTLTKSVTKPPFVDTQTSTDAIAKSVNKSSSDSLSLSESIVTTFKKALSDTVSLIENFSFFADGHIGDSASLLEGFAKTIRKLFSDSTTVSDSTLIKSVSKPLPETQPITDSLNKEVSRNASETQFVTDNGVTITITSSLSDNTRMGEWINIKLIKDNRWS